MKRHQPRRLVALLLVCGLFTIVPLAQGSPPDPTWVAGLYDDGDHDDVVLAITGASALPAMAVVAVARTTAPTSRVVPLGATRVPTSCRISPVDRAPPSR